MTVVIELKCVIHPSPLPQNLRHFLQRPAHPQQLVFAEDDQAFIVRVIGEPYELDDFRIDRDFLAGIPGTLRN